MAPENGPVAKCFKLHTTNEEDQMPSATGYSS